MRELEKAYYERRAPEYDDWWLGTGLFAQRQRPGWHDEVAGLVELIGALSPMRTLDVACGTGFLTRHLRGDVTGLDQSAAMLAVARERLPNGTELVRAEVPPLPFADASFGRVFTSHFYGHLDAATRVAFLAEARRAAGELLVVDSGGGDHEELQERVLNDGSRPEVYKRRFSGPSLAAELGGGEVLLDGVWFVVVRVRSRPFPPSGQDVDLDARGG
jgi:ubiquinone/menaquinone biosynthesis C-methylase UbiE